MLIVMPILLCLLGEKDWIINHQEKAHNKSSGSASLSSTQQFSYEAYIASKKMNYQVPQIRVIIMIHEKAKVLMIIMEVVIMKIIGEIIIHIFF